MTEAQSAVVAAAPGPRRLLARLRGGFLRVEVQGESLTLVQARGKPPIVISAGSIDQVTRVGPWFRHRLVVDSREQATDIEIGLWRRGASEIVDALANVSERLAGEVEPILAAALDYLSGDRYRRRSTLEAVYRGLPEAIAKSRGQLVRARLSERVQRRWEHLRQASVTEHAFDHDRETANRAYVDRVFPSVTKQVEHHFERAPTEEQARAIATDEDATLVLAGAGSGKTTVILGKIAHLIEQGVPPREILVLAFNREAAAEIRERLPLELDGVDVSTYHAFGNQVVGHAEGSRRSVSILAQNERRRTAALQAYLLDMLIDPATTADLQRFLLFNLGEYASPFDFETMGEYLDHIRREELTSLNGDRVRSFEELEIANFLAVNSVQYVYEADYPVATATIDYRQYRPDFYLTDYDIYIEHFGLDEQGEPPAAWGQRTGERYLAGVKWKRETHERYGTKLLETYSWQRSRGILTSTLRHLLLQEGVELRPLGQEELLRRLNEANQVSRLVELVDSFLQHTKTANLPAEELGNRVDMLEDERRRQRAELFLPIFLSIQERYERDVQMEGIDFHDMINLAVDHIASGRWPSPYRYVLVDEFQDIAWNRMMLIAALRRPGVAYLLVGDDWQAINRFAGSDLRLMQDAAVHLGFVRERHLTRTFRYGLQLERVSSTFVQRNPMQSQREQLPVEVEGEVGVVVAALRVERLLEDKRTGRQVSWPVRLEQATAELVQQILDEIRSEPNGQGALVLFLGRYNFSKPRWLPDGLEFSTVHRAKGREADFVIVLDLRDAKYGFPAQITDDPLLELVTPLADGFEFAEERRLFYVAMTRARRGVFLVADAVRPSRFVRELLRDHGDEIHRIGELELDRWPPCAMCESGVLQRSHNGRSLRCINAECPGRAPACECGRGYRLIDEPGKTCTEESCTAAYANCPRCERGIMLRRMNGRDGSEFWSCSEWGAISCGWTQNLDPIKYPSWRCPRCGEGVVRAMNGNYGLFWGCDRYRDDPPCRYTRNTPPRGAALTPRLSVERPG